MNTKEMRPSLLFAHIIRLHNKYKIARFIRIYNIYIYIIVEKIPNSSHLYDQGFMANTNRQAVCTSEKKIRQVIHKQQKNYNKNRHNTTKSIKKTVTI